MPGVLHRAYTYPLLMVLVLGSAAIAPGTTTANRGQTGTPAIQIVSPASGSTITTDDVALRFRIADFAVDCSRSGRPEQAGVGHVHVLLDGLLVDLGCRDTFTIAGYGLAPGKHTLVAKLAANRHQNLVASNAVEIDYRPATPRPLPLGLDLGTPGARLVSPPDGATVPATFRVAVDSVNFVPLGALSAKPNVAGYGQWLVRVDGRDVMYAGSNTFGLGLTAWGAGTHTIGVLPVQNDHHGFEGVSPMEFRVEVEEAATPSA